MRKRPLDEANIVPGRCEHPVVTYGGETAPACTWGLTEALAIPSGCIGAAMLKARREHFRWEGARSVPREELLGPDGFPFERRPLWEVSQ